MGTKPLDELMMLWKHEKMTVEMAIGHIIQNIVLLKEENNMRSTLLYKLRADVSNLIVKSEIQSDPKQENY